MIPELVDSLKEYLISRRSLKKIDLKWVAAVMVWCNFWLAQKTIWPTVGNDEWNSIESFVRQTRVHFIVLQLFN